MMGFGRAPLFAVLVAAQLAGHASAQESNESTADAGAQVGEYPHHKEIWGTILHQKDPKDPLRYAAAHHSLAQILQLQLRACLRLGPSRTVYSGDIPPERARAIHTHALALLADMIKAILQCGARYRCR